MSARKDSHMQNQTFSNTVKENALPADLSADPARETSLLQEKARQLMQSHQFDEAGEIFKRLIQIEGEKPAYLNSLGVSFVLRQRPDLALPHLEKAVQSEPEQAFFLANLGQAHLLLRQWKKAKPWLEKALLLCGPNEKAPIQNLLQACLENMPSTSEEKTASETACQKDAKTPEQAEAKTDPVPKLKSEIKNQGYAEDFCPGGIEVQMAVRTPCNYNCSYCVANVATDQPFPFNLAAIEARYQGFKDFVLTTLECQKGEPTLHPQLGELLKVCTRYGMVSMPSNNSQDPARWLPEEAAPRVSLRAALHPQGEKDLTGFTSRLLKARDMGAQVSTIYVCHPKRLAKAKEYQEYFAKYNIETTLTPFDGEYQGKTYPLAYTKEERRLLGDDNTTYWYHTLSTEIPTRNFSGIPCLAGYRSLIMDPTGGVYRCLYDLAKLDTPLEAPLPCRVSHCGCGLLLAELNTHDATMWNGWREKAGLEPMPADKMNNEEKLLHARAKCFELMAKHGKFQPLSKG